MASSGFFFFWSSPTGDKGGRMNVTPNENAARSKAEHYSFHASSATREWWWSHQDRKDKRNLEILKTRVQNEVERDLGYRLSPLLPIYRQCHAKHSDSAGKTPSVEEFTAVLTQAGDIRVEIKRQKKAQQRSNEVCYSRPSGPITCWCKAMLCCYYCKSKGWFLFLLISTSYMCKITNLG